MNARTLIRVTRVLWLVVVVLFLGLEQPLAESVWSKSFEVSATAQFATRSISLPTQIDLEGARTEQTHAVDLQLVVDLAPLQTNASSLVAVPRDNCRSFSSNNMVFNAPAVSARVEDRKLTLNFRGNVTQWLCAENPVPITKVEWVMQDVGLGIKTKVPVVVTSKGPPIKTVVRESPYAFSGTFTFDTKPNGIGVLQALVFEPPVDPVLRTTVESSIAELVTTLQKVVDIKTVQNLLPAQVRQLAFAPKKAEFGTKDGRPVAILNYSAPVDAAQIESLRSALN